MYPCQENSIRAQRPAPRHGVHIHALLYIQRVQRRSQLPSWDRNDRRLSSASPSSDGLCRLGVPTDGIVPEARGYKVRSRSIATPRGKARRRRIRRRWARNSPQCTPTTHFLPDLHPPMSHPELSMKLVNRQYGSHRASFKRKARCMCGLRKSFSRSS